MEVLYPRPRFWILYGFDFWCNVSRLKNMPCQNPRQGRNSNNQQHLFLLWNNDFVRLQISDLCCIFLTKKSSSLQPIGWKITNFPARTKQYTHHSFLSITDVSWLKWHDIDKNKNKNSIQLLLTKYFDENVFTFCFEALFSCYYVQLRFRIFYWKQQQSLISRENKKREKEICRDVDYVHTYLEMELKKEEEEAE